MLAQAKAITRQPLRSQAAPGPVTERTPPDKPQTSRRTSTGRLRSTADHASGPAREPDPPRTRGQPTARMTHMKAAVIYENGGPDVLRYEDEHAPLRPDGGPVGEPGAGSTEERDI